MEETIRATIILSNQAVKLRARKECVDREGVQRVTGEEWLVKKTGAYLPGAYEEVVELVNAYVLTEKVSLNQTIRRKTITCLRCKTLQYTSTCHWSLHTYFIATYL